MSIKSLQMFNENDDYTFFGCLKTFFKVFRCGAQIGDITFCFAEVDHLAEVKCCGISCCWNNALKCYKSFS